MEFLPRCVQWARFVAAFYLSFFFFFSCLFAPIFLKRWLHCSYTNPHTNTSWARNQWVEAASQMVYHSPCLRDGWEKDGRRPPHVWNAAVKPFVSRGGHYCAWFGFFLSSFSFSSHSESLSRYWSRSQCIRCKCGFFLCEWKVCMQAPRRQEVGQGEGYPTWRSFCNGI